MTFQGSSKASNLDYPHISNQFEQPRPCCQFIIRQKGSHIPKIIRPIRQTLTHPIIHKVIHLINPRHAPTPRRTRRGISPAIRTPTTRPPGLRNDILRGIRDQLRIVRLPELPRPPRRLGDGRACEKGVDVRHDVVCILGETGGPCVAEVGGRDGEVDVLSGEVFAGVGQGVADLGFGHVFAVEDFVADDDTDEGSGAGFREDVVHGADSAVVGCGVCVEPDAEPYFHGGEGELVDCVEDHFCLVAVGAVEADGVCELG